MYCLGCKGLQRVECYVVCTLNLLCNLATLLVWMSDPRTLASSSSSIPARLSKTPCAVETVWLRKLGVSLVNGLQNLLPTRKEMLPGTFIAMHHCRWNPTLVLEFQFELSCKSNLDMSFHFHFFKSPHPTKSSLWIIWSPRNLLWWRWPKQSQLVPPRATGWIIAELAES